MNFTSAMNVNRYIKRQEKVHRIILSHKLVDQVFSWALPQLIAQLDYLCYCSMGICVDHFTTQTTICALHNFCHNLHSSEQI